MCLHCGLCAERCPTGAWDMKKFYLETAQAEFMPEPIVATNDFVVKFANVNGSGSASANELFAKCVLRMGVPVASRNIFPSNIQGLPTWYEVRISGDNWLGRRGGVDLMVAMNPQTWDKDVASIDPGGYLLYDSTKPLPPSKFREDIEFHRRAADGNLQPHLYRSAPAPAVQEHHLCRRAGRRCSSIEPKVVEEAIAAQFTGQGKAHRAEREGVPARLRLCERTSGGRLRAQAGTRE